MVGSFLPFCSFQNQSVRNWQKRTSKAAYNTAVLYPALVKKRVVELYCYVHSKLSVGLQSAKEGRKLPSFSMNLDLWKSLVSGEKYLGRYLLSCSDLHASSHGRLSLLFTSLSGIRLYWIDRNWKFNTSLLAVRRFRPSPEQNDYKAVASEILKEWAGHVLLDFNLTWADIFGATSDAGPDVKAVFCNVLNMVSASL